MMEHRDGKTSNVKTLSREQNLKLADLDRAFILINIDGKHWIDNKNKLCFKTLSR